MHCIDTDRLLGLGCRCRGGGIGGIVGIAGSPDRWDRDSGEGEGLPSRAWALGKCIAQVGPALKRN